jgi:hypothetical protein
VASSVLPVETLSPTLPRKGGGSSPFVKRQCRHKQTHHRIPAARFARVLQIHSPNKSRGRRECRMRAASAVSCAACTKKWTHEHTGQRRASDIPCAVALRLITGSPRRTALLPPSRPGKSDVSRVHGRQRRGVGTTRLCRTPSAPLVQRPAPRPPQPVPRRDDGQRPSERDGMAEDVPLIWGFGKAKYFLFPGLT